MMVVRVVYLDTPPLQTKENACLPFLTVKVIILVIKKASNWNADSVKILTI